MGGNGSRGEERSVEKQGGEERARKVEEMGGEKQGGEW